MLLSSSLWFGPFYLVIDPWNTSGTWRVGGILAVSRAFGDKQLKPFVIAEPEIQVNRWFTLDVLGI